jgi:iron(III) transport system substrate-binding protein
VERGASNRRRAARWVLGVGIAAVVAVVLGSCASGDDDTLRIYSGRHYGLEGAFEQFSEETGIDVEFQFGNDAELREKLVAEGEDTPADVYITVDAGNLVRGTEQGIFQPLDSAVLDEAIPEYLRDPEGHWYGLSERVRSIVYNPDEVDPSELSTYADLADPEWDGRLCLRNSSGGYQQSLVAQLIADEGYDEALRIVEGWLANAEIMENDVMILDSVAEGRCDVGIANHYYLARKYAEDPDFGVRMFWADQDGNGVHVNTSGGGITAHANNPEEARELLEWLATDGQEAFLAGQHELPANPDVEPDEVVREHFELDFVRNPMPVWEYGALNAQAVELMNEAGYR